ncbi:MAG: Cyclic dehypoxanthine futalosine synthase [Elusimicrobia bacterium]|nr:Cyclic dehypoxanthine futalosine synthase [Elusimicrobiota bacterium]
MNSKDFANQECCVNLPLIEKKILNRERLTSQEGLFLLKDAPLNWLGQMAMEERYRRSPEKEITFIIDSNPNYTNICDTDCHFCAFFRRPQDKDSYTLTIDQVMEKIDRSVKLGVTTILLQGGHNRAIPFDYYLSLIRETRERFPSVTPHFFTASEIQTMAQVNGCSVSQVLAELKKAGQHTLPGGGAEILSERVRKKLSPKKGGPEAWLEVHREAHRQGFTSTATMMYGHIEEPEDVVEHWNQIRSLQDSSKSLNNGGGFTAFIPWSFKPDNTVLERRFPRRAGPVPYLRMLAASRLYLDNFDHIQASWFSEGKKTGQAALFFGADDFGGTLYEENVHAEAGFVNVTTLKETIQLIHEAGFDAVQRTTRYDRLKKFPKNMSEDELTVAVAPEVSLRKNQPVEKRNEPVSA